MNKTKKKKCSLNTSHSLLIFVWVQLKGKKKKKKRHRTNIVMRVFIGNIMFVEQSFGTVTNCYRKLTNQTLIKTSRKSQIGTETVVCVCLFVCFLSLCEWCWPWQCLCTALSRSLWRCGSDPAQWATLEAAQFFLLDRSLSLING